MAWYSYLGSSLRHFLILKSFVKIHSLNILLRYFLFLVNIFCTSYQIRSIVFWKPFRVKNLRFLCFLIFILKDFSCLYGANENDIYKNTSITTRFFLLCRHFYSITFFRGGNNASKSKIQSISICVYLLLFPSICPDMSTSIFKFPPNLQMKKIFPLFSFLFALTYLPSYIQYFPFHLPYLPSTSFIKTSIYRNLRNTYLQISS